jgi:L-lactate dehydrogenase
VARLLDVILHDQRAVLTTCCRVEGVPEFAGITFALLHLVHGGGVLATLPPRLDDIDRASLQRRASVLRDAIGSLRLAHGSALGRPGTER